MKVFLVQFSGPCCGANIIVVAKSKHGVRQRVRSEVKTWKHCRVDMEAVSEATIDEIVLKPQVLTITNGDC